MIEACNEYVLYSYSELYLDEYHQRLFQWHISNLEFANGTNLCNLSLAEWNQDDEYSFTGSHVFGLYFVYKYKHYISVFILTIHFIFVIFDEKSLVHDM